MPRWPKDKSLLDIRSIKVCLAADNTDETLLFKLLSNIRYNEKGCWIRGEDSQVYTKINGEAAHRISYELFKGEKLPYNRLACHTCDVPACINPEHLYKGTTAQNNKDSIARSGLGKIERVDKFNSIEFRTLKSRKGTTPDNTESPKVRSYIADGKHYGPDPTSRI